MSLGVEGLNSLVEYRTINKTQGLSSDQTIQLTGDPKSLAPIKPCIILYPGHIFNFHELAISLF